MADLFCSFLPLFLPPKRYSSSALHSHNSKISRIKRRPPHLPLLFKPSPFAASASDIDVISTHEHSDGSFLFRFGDPSEVVKNVEMEESKDVEEIDGEDTNGSRMMKVVEDEDEGEVTASGLTEASDRSDSIVSTSNTLITVEGESEFSEKLLVETELPVLTSNQDMGGISSSDLDVEQIRINQEYKDLSLLESSIPDESSQIENIIVEVSDDEVLKETSKVTCTSKEMETTYIHGVEECPKQEDVDSPGDASILNHSSEVVDNVTTVALPERENDDISSADIDADEPGKVEGSLDGNYEDSPVDAFVLDKSSEVGSGTFAVVVLEKETDGSTSSSDIEIEPTINVEEGINEEYGDSPVDITSAPDTDIECTGNVEKGQDEVLEEPSSVEKRPQVENCITAQDILANETADATFAPDIDIEYSGNVEQGPDEVLDEPSSAKKKPEVENCITAQVLLEKETAEITSSSDIDIEYTGKVERVLDEVLEEPSSVEKRPEVENRITAKEFLEKETADINSAPDIDIEYTGNVEQSLDEVLDEPSSVDKRPEEENLITAQELLDKETADATTLVALKSDPVVPVLDADTSGGGLETAVTPNAVPISEFQTVIHEETIGDSRESFDDNLVSPSSQSEPPMSLYKEAEAPNLQAEVKKLATEESSKTNVNNIAIEIQNVLSNDNLSDMFGAEDESPTMEPDMAGSVVSKEQASGSGSWMLNESVVYVSEKDVIPLLTVSPQLEAESMLEEETETVEEPQEDDESKNKTVGGDLADASVHEMTDPKSTESTITSQEILMTDFILYSGAALVPHPSKVLTGGEDAYFIADETWFGVADGASHWLWEGTISGVYAHELIKNCEKLISECSGNSINNPIELLNLSVAQTHSPGSSTVLIAQFDGQALHVANVGDSGFIILRHGAVYKRSSPMHHVFSLPVQIERGDNPSSLAQLYRVELEEEDIIVTATDGLLDNLYDREILLIATKSLANNKTPKEIAELLAKKAQEIGSSASARSPFADDAQAAGFPGYTGGKLDDVVVIVSVVQRR